MPIFINRENQSNKYWKYQVNGLSVHVSWGRIGGSAESQVKTFSSQGSMHAFISDKVSEKLRKGYREASENELQKEVQTAKSLGIENKIQRLLWVELSGRTLRLLNTYDPAKYVYVEVLNSWSKQITRLLLSRSGSWQLSDGISEFDRTISFDTRRPVSGERERFANTVRQMLRDMAVTVTEALKTVKFAAVGARNLFDSEASGAEVPELNEIAAPGFDRQVISKFAALGQRTLEL
jgi:predicted DNA-binding WGR domain protein